MTNQLQQDHESDSQHQQDYESDNQHQQDYEEEHFDENEIEHIVETLSDKEPMSEDDSDVENQNDNNERQEDDEKFEFHDDSIQGFFTHSPHPVYTIAINPCHQHIICSGGGDDKAYLWDRLTGALISLLTPSHTDSVICVRFSKDGMYVGTAGMDGILHIFDGITGAHVCTFDGPDEIVWIDWHPKGAVVLAGAADGTLWMWNVKTNLCMNVFSGHSGPVSCGMFSPSGKNIISASEDGTCLVWDPKNASITQKFSAQLDGRFHTDALNVIACNAQSQLILTGSQDGSARLLHLSTGRILSSLPHEADSVEAVCFCEVLQVAVTADVMGNIHVWDTHSFILRNTLKHEDSVTKLVSVEGTSYIVSCSADKSVIMWDLRNGSKVREWKGHQDIILDVAVGGGETGGFIVSCGDDGVALVFGVAE